MKTLIQISITKKRRKKKKKKKKGHDPSRYILSNFRVDFEQGNAARMSTLRNGMCHVTNIFYIVNRLHVEY